MVCALFFRSDPGNGGLYRRRYTEVLEAVNAESLNLDDPDYRSVHRAVDMELNSLEYMWGSLTAAYAAARIELLR